jgi:hypothetical protein
MSSEFPRQGIKRPLQVSFAEIWLRDGPLHIQGVLDIISTYSQEFEGICLLTLAGHTACVYALALLPDGKLASGSDDDTVRVWDTASGACLRTLHTVGCMYALAVLPDELSDMMAGVSDRWGQVVHLTRKVTADIITLRQTNEDLQRSYDMLKVQHQSLVEAEGMRIAQSDQRLKAAEQRAALLSRRVIQLESSLKKFQHVSIPSLCPVAAWYH